MEGDYIRPLSTFDPALAADVASALAGRRVPPVISGFVGPRFLTRGGGRSLRSREGRASRGRTARVARG